MPNEIDSLIQTNKLYQKTADKILQLKNADKKALLRFIRSFRLNINYAREFVDYIIDIARREGVGSREVVGNEKIQNIHKEEKLSYARRMDLVRDYLRRRRYPYFYGERQGCREWGVGSRERKLAVSRELSAIKTVYVEKAVQNLPVTIRVLHAYPKVPVKIIESVKEVIKLYTNFEEGKQIITLAEQKGKWLERCPGTQGHICCNYLVINNAVNCPFDCTYCYLQTYLNNKVITIYANTDELIFQLQQFMEEHIDEHFRIGTGEFTDSLALDQPTGLGRQLVEIFAQQDSHLLELKTKSTEIGHLLDLEHRNKTVLAWSVNPEKIVMSEERGSGSLKARLKAAKQAIKAGYKVAFHFDPIIFYPGWEKDYKQVVNSIFKAVTGDDIAWISLGALRYQPVMKEIIENRHPHSRISLGELDIGEDHKMRYFMPIRIEIFKKMSQFIRQHSKNVYIYLCMESPEVWAAAGIRNPSSNPYGKYFKFFRKEAII